MKKEDISIAQPSLFSAMVYVIPGMLLLLAGFWIGFRGTSFSNTRMIAGLVFAVAGLIMGSYGSGSYWRQRQKFLLYEQYPWRPWKIYPCWQTFTIKSQQLKKVLAKLPATIFFTIFALPLLWNFFVSNDSTSWKLKIIGFLWVITTLGLIFDLITTAYRLLKFGESEIILSQKPLVPGHEADIYIILPTNVNQGTFKVKFYLEEVWTGAEAPSDKTLFEKAMTVQRKPSDIYKGKPFVKATLPIPKETHDSQPEGSHLFEWRLEVSAPASKGVGLKTDFLLPVFKVKNEKYIEHNPVKIKT
ncbi:MAG: hypothetical protein ACQETH_03640 [Candidatus Rifleibacteriota bacterium]